MTIMSTRESLAFGADLRSDTAALHGLVPRSGLVLDLGCGYGAAAHWLAQSGPERQVLGVDYLSEVDISAKEESQLSTIQTKVTLLLRKRHRMADDVDNDFNVRNQAGLSAYRRFMSASSMKSRCRRSW
jgi:SAM-dependent methyltransferase